MAYETYTPREITSLMNLVDTYIRWRSYDKRGDRKYQHYHPSEWGKCLRMQQYKHYAWKGLIEVEHGDVNSTKQRLFDKGHNMHERWSNYFTDIGGVLLGLWKCKNPLCLMFADDGKIKTPDVSVDALYKGGKTRVHGEAGSPILKPEKCLCGCRDFEYIETPVISEELNIQGRADLVLNCDNIKEERFKGVPITYNRDFLPINGSRVVGDMKTIGSKPWVNQLQRKGPHKDYLIQLTLYVHILDCDYGIIMYENKDTSEMKWYQVKRNDLWWEIIQDQAKRMIKMAEMKKLPPPKFATKKIGRAHV